MPPFEFTDPAREPSGNHLRARTAILQAQLRSNHPSKLPVAESLFDQLSLNRMVGPSRRQLADITRQLASLASANLPLVRALRLVAAQKSDSSIHGVIADIADKVDAGHTLAESLSKYPSIFNPLFINLMEAGEKAGLVGRVLGQLADCQVREEVLRGKVGNALTYPVAIMVVSMGAALVLLTHVIPLFAEMYHQSSVPLPAPTQFVISLSDMVIAGWSWGLTVTTSIMFVTIKYCRRRETRLSLDRFRLRLPFLGPIYHGAALSRFSDSLGMLLESGIPLVNALTAARHTLLNLHLESGIIESATAVNQGSSLADSMSGNSGWPEIMTQTIGIGEETGDLASSLKHLVSYYTKDVEHRTERLTAIMEPLLIVSVAIVVGGFLIAMYLPIFNLSEVVV